MVKFDDILHEINDFGRYQKIRYYLICIAGLLPPIVTYIHSFLAANPNHKCILPESTSNLYTNGTNVTLEKCHYMVNNTKYDCKAWEFDKTHYQSTLTEEWEMVCDKASFRSYVQMVYFSGYLVGSLVLGYMADVFGRRPIMLSSFILIIAGGVGAAFGPQKSFGIVASYVIYSVSRFLIACGTRGINVTGYILALEIVGTTQRGFAGIIFEGFFAFGQILLVAGAYFIRDWRTLAWAMVVPCVPFLGYFFIISESPRWLISKNRSEEAFEILENVAKSNKRVLNKDTWQGFLSDASNKPERHENFLDLIKSPILVLITFTMFFQWIVNNFVFYGVGLKANDLGVNPYLSFGVSACVELVACIVCFFLINKLGRKGPYICSLLLAGVSCCSIFFFKNNLVVGVILAMIGKFAISASYAIIHLYSSEVFPTTIRTTCMGACSMMARVGAMTAPLINSLDDEVKSLPFLIFGISGVLAAVSSIVLPETYNVKLPENVREAEKMSTMKCCKKCVKYNKDDEAPYDLEER